MHIFFCDRYCSINQRLQIKTDRFQISTSVLMRCCKFSPSIYMSSLLEPRTTHTLPLGTEWTHISTRQPKSAVSNYTPLIFTSLEFYSSLTFPQQLTYITIYVQQSLAFFVTPDIVIHHYQWDAGLEHKIRLKRMKHISSKRFDV